MESQKAKDYIDRLAPITDRSKIYARIIAIKAVELAEEEEVNNKEDVNRQNQHSGPNEPGE